MKMVGLWMLLIIFPGFGANAQHDSIVQVYQLDEQRAYYLQVKKNMANYYNDSVYLRFTIDAGKTFTNVNAGLVNTYLQKQNRITEISIHFTSEQTGFIYGYLTGYGYYPFLFRTGDGGKSWTYIMDGNDDKGSLATGVPLRRNDFYMFNDEKGILLNNWHNPEGMLQYKLTNDGGITWTQHSFALETKDISVSNSKENLTAYYSAKGIVNLVVFNRDYSFNRHTKVVVLQSVDFGRRFRELK